MIKYYHKDVVVVQIRPVSDLRNKYLEIEQLVLAEKQEVYLTKNGCGSMVVMSIEKYTKLLEEIDVARALELRFAGIDIEKVLMKTAEDIKNGNMKYLTHEEVFENARRIVDGKKDI